MPPLHRIYNDTFLALSLTPLFVRQIRAVIAPLDPGHKGEDLLNRRRTQGQDDLQSSPELGHGEGRRFFSPSGVSGATEKNVPTWSSAYGGATRDISALHSGPCPVQFYFLRSIVPPPSAVHLTTQRSARACSPGHCSCSNNSRQWPLYSM